MHRHAIGAVVMGEAKIVAADPIILAAPRIHSFDDGFAIVAFAHARQLPAFELVAGQRRHIDIKQRRRRKAALLNFADQLGGELRRGVEVKILKRDQGNGDGGNAEQRCF